MERPGKKNKSFPGARGGFSLIELLVIIAFITLIMTIVLASFSTVRKQSRDSRRYADLTAVQTALELYWSVNGAYPSTGGQWWTVCTTGNDTTARDTSGPNGYVPDLAPAYIRELPTDPSGCIGGSYDGYIYKSNGINYKFSADWTAEIGAECETGKRFEDWRFGVTPSCGITTPCNDAFCSIYTPGGESW